MRSTTSSPESPLPRARECAAAPPASRALASGEGATDFMQAKQGTTNAYMAYCLPEVDKLAAKMRHGPEALAAIDPDWL